ncbi:MAG TPA: hypothetical protein VF117_03865 [Gammaproteobacteria bacterium]
MQSTRPLFVVPMSFLATLSLPTDSAWGSALTGPLDAGNPVNGKTPARAGHRVPSGETIEHLGRFEVIELRRYTTLHGARQTFASYFESFFPEAFEQLGAMVFGSFCERGNETGFTWLRGFHDINARAIVNAAFYYGPLWKEHRNRMNNILPDSDNVLLLKPLSPERGVTLLPAMDPVLEAGGAEGVMVAQIFPVAEHRIDEFSRQAEPVFARYRAAGIHEAGVLVTLDVANNFPQLPVREDGPYLVWLGLLKDDEMLQEQFMTLEKQHRPFFHGTGLLRDEPELLIMDPTRRSRLRWLGA